MTDLKQKPWIGRVLMHPITVLVGIAAGVYIGTRHKGIALHLAKPSAIYLGLLQMCVLPIMISAVILSVGRLLQSGKATSFILRIVAVFIVGMLIASAVGVGLGVLGKPGADLDKEQKALLGKEIVKVEMGGDSLSEASTKQEGVLDFIQMMIPQNVFQSIAEGRNLPVLFFCIVIGIALGSARSRSSEVALSVVDASYEALLKVIGWMMYGLPFGLCCLFADQVSHIGAAIFAALLKLVVFMFIAAILLLIFYILIIRFRARRSLKETCLALRETLLVAVGTSSSFAALPFSLEGLHKNLGFKKDTVDLVIPLGTTLNPHGNVVCFAMVAAFMAQLYEVPLGPSGIITIVCLAAVAGVVASSAPGIAGLSMLAIVLDPFGLPTVVAIILLTAINAIIDPVLTAVNVFGNCASAALVAEPSSDDY